MRQNYQYTRQRADSLEKALKSSQAITEIEQSKNRALTAAKDSLGNVVWAQNGELVKTHQQLKNERIAGRIGYGVAALLFFILIL